MSPLSTLPPACLPSLSGRSESAKPDQVAEVLICLNSKLNQGDVCATVKAGGVYKN